MGYSCKTFFSTTMASFLIFVCINLFCLISSSNAVDFPYKVGHFDQTIDHFNQMSNGEKTFKQKYLFQDNYWKKGSGPIFFYAGNEGPIEGFWKASGFVHEFAPKAEAFVIFPEHRFYGSSLPFGNSSFKSPNLGLLTVEQAMADYAVLLTNFAKTNNATDCKIIAFGGSYGGMLAAYMRFKYPNIIYGSLAASAPIYMQDPQGPRNFFFKHVTEDFRQESELCYNTVKKVFVTMNEIASTGETGLRTLTGYLKLCKQLKGDADYQHMLKWIRNAFTIMAMCDYPYSSSLIGNLPAYPVKAACKALLSASNPITGLGQAAGVFYNNSLTCFDIYSEFIDCADPTGCGLGNDATAWDYQACTDVWLPQGSNNMTDMFPVLPWNDALRADYCKKTYGVTPRTEWPSIQFWGEKVKSSSRIIFSNGNLDPWMGGGVAKNLSDSLVAILVEGGAHHLDLRASNPADPQGVIKARQQERDIIMKWIKET